MTNAAKELVAPRRQIMNDYVNAARDFGPIVTGSPSLAFNDNQCLGTARVPAKNQMR